MHNDALTHDYVIRAGKRLLAVEVLFRESSWADVVRECQEIVELSLKALLRSCRVEVPRIHDVSGALEIMNAWDFDIMNAWDFMMSVALWKSIRTDFQNQRAVLWLI